MNSTDETIVVLLEKISHIVRYLMWETAKIEKLSPVQMQV